MLFVLSDKGSDVTMEQPYVDPYSPLHLRSTLRLPTSSLQVYMGLFASRQRSLVIDTTDVTPGEWFPLSIQQFRHAHH